MPFLSSSKSRRIPSRFAMFVAAALVLTGCGMAHNGSSTGSHHRAIATQSEPPSSVCGSNGDYVNQSLNGDFTACFRVPALTSSSLVVALQAYVDGPLKSDHSPTTTLTTIPVGHLSLTLSANTATPGESITVTGHYSSRPPTTRPFNANLCWDGCQGGLQEEGAPLHWTSRTTFQARLKVPDTAWLVHGENTVSVHQLRSGSYAVGIECIQVESGCALGRAAAQTTIELNAPAPRKCGSGQRCEWMHLSTTKAQVGDIVKLKGWAPLQLLLGQPFSYSLSITTASPTQKYYPLSFSRLSKTGGFNVVLTPRALRVVPGETWANLGRAPYLSSTFAGPSSVEPEPGSPLIAWCLASGVEITGGSATVTAPTVGVAAALRDTNLRSFSSKPPQCETVVLDPTHRGTIYAGFDTDSGGSAPPIYLAALYTTDGGATWRTVPPPPGTTLEDFGGFTTEGHRVLALFAGLKSYNSRNYPEGTVHGLVSVEATSDGGVHWTPSTLGCPSAGPCATLGTYSWGNCNMNPGPQSLLLGPAGASAPSGVRWTSSNWVTSVDSCRSPQLVVNSSHDLMVVDPSSQYSVVRSTNSGSTWTYVALPRIPGTNYAPDSTPYANSLLLAPNGSLYAALTTSSSPHQELFRLEPHATSWCLVPRVFETVSPSTNFSRLRVSRSDLLWSQTGYAGAKSTSSVHAVPFSTLHC
jgi:hypothetical protein